MDKEEIYRKAKEEIKDFGKKPIKDVGIIMNLVQASSIKEKETMPLTQEIYIKLFQENGRGDLNMARQSWVVASGNNFEIFMRNFINENLNKEGIVAIKGDQLRNKPKTEEMVKFLTLAAKRRCTQTSTGVWPDSDIVVISRENGDKLKAFTLLNCKTSDHSRNDAVLFWALALRDNNIKYCLLTQDLDNKFKSGHEKPTSLRRKAEAYLDRVYSTNPLTKPCSQVLKLDFTKTDGASLLLEDLRTWRKEVVPNFESAPLTIKDIIN